MALFIRSWCISEETPAVGRDAAAAPDQVLVIYNKDWTEDRDGTEPGQDSEELARYYVAAHTDPVTGKKPYLLGLSSTDPKSPYLNQVTPPERSRDNPWGLKYVGKGNCKPLPDAPPLASGYFGQIIPGRDVKEGDRRCLYAAVFLSAEHMGRFNPDDISLLLETPPPVAQKLDLFHPPQGTQIRLQRYPVQKPNGLCFIVRVFGRYGTKFKLQLCVGKEGAPDRLTSSADFDLAEPPVAKDRISVPEKSGLFPRLISEEDIRQLFPEGLMWNGFLIPPQLSPQVNPDSIALSGNAKDDRASAQTLYAHGRGAALGTVLLPLNNGGLILSLDFDEAEPTGEYIFWFEASDKQGKKIIDQKYHYYPPSDFAFDPTGPDGIRDDQNYLDNIEQPVKRFLEDPANALPDGTLLKDHILYIAVMHGLPFQVPTPYGVIRGEPMNGIGNMGRGAALTQRLSLMYFEPKLEVAAQLLARPEGTLASVLSSLTVMIHPWDGSLYTVPGTYRGNPPSLAGIPRFSTKLRREKKELLYGASRVDAPSPILARQQIDAALWAGKYLTPKLGQVYFRGFQQGQTAAEMARKLGFNVPKDIPSQEALLDRSLFVFGVFGYGPRYYEDIGKGPGDDRCVPFIKGFYPGSFACVRRSFLGWTRKDLPSQFENYTAKLLDAGVSLTTGAVGGAHDTTHSGPDEGLFINMITAGYDYADAILRSTIYRGWTMEYFGDPLYNTDLRRTAIPPPVSLGSKEKIKLEFVPTWGEYTAVVSADIGHTPRTPAFAWIRAELGDAAGKHTQPLSGEDTFFSTRPRVAVTGLRPATEYSVRVILTDPYERSFDSQLVWPDWRIKTPTVADGPKPVWEFDAAATKDRRLALSDELAQKLLEAGAIECTFTAGQSTRLLHSESGEIVFDVGAGGLRAGGAIAAPCGYADNTKPVFAPKQTYKLRCFYRRSPTVREMYVIDNDGQPHLLGANNRVPWLAIKRLGRWVEVGPNVDKLALYADSPGPNPAGGELYPHYYR